MAKTAVYNQSGEKVAEADLQPAIFEVRPDVALVEQAVRTQLANRRRSIAATKTRAEVRGGGRKPWRQKGTGRARHGSIRSPLWAGGGVTFGPNPERNWRLKINKTAYRKALYMVLSDKLSTNSLVVVDNLDIGEGKTKTLAQTIKELLTNVKVAGRQSLIIYNGKNTELEKAAKNLKAVILLRADSLNVFDLLKADNLIILQSALPVIEKVYLKSDKEA